MLILNSIRNAKAITEAYNFVIARYVRNIPSGFEHIPELAPSYALFLQYRKWKAEGLWPLKSYEYKERFLAEMNRNPMKEYLRYVQDLLDANETIQMICFCPDWHYCHRGLIGEYFKNLGYEVQFG